MRVWAGTSGFSYKEWRGAFYPDTLKPVDYLRHYSRQLPAVEINSTFYRMPRSEVVAAWFDDTPDDFRFVLKGSRRITHQQRLQNVGDSVAYLFRVAAILKHKLGAVLFQLPPNLRKDVPRLRAFLALLPEGCRAALEFRHPSWADPEVVAVLRDHGAALCGGDEEGTSVPLEPTARWGYVRLREEAYTDAELTAWAEQLQSQPWDEAFVFFKHEERAPGLAARLLDALPRRPGLARATPPEPAPLTKAPAVGATHPGALARTSRS